MTKKVHKNDRTFLDLFTGGNENRIYNGYLKAIDDALKNNQQVSPEDMSVDDLVNAWNNRKKIAKDAVADKAQRDLKLIRHANNAANFISNPGFTVEYQLPDTNHKKGLWDFRYGSETQGSHVPQKGFETAFDADKPYNPDGSPRERNMFASLAQSLGAKGLSELADKLHEDLPEVYDQVFDPDMYMINNAIKEKFPDIYRGYNTEQDLINMVMRANGVNPEDDTERAEAEEASQSFMPSWKREGREYDPTRDKEELEARLARGNNNQKLHYKLNSYGDDFVDERYKENPNDEGYSITDRGMIGSGFMKQMNDWEEKKRIEAERQARIEQEAAERRSNEQWAREMLKSNNPDFWLNDPKDKRYYNTAAARQYRAMLAKKQAQQRTALAQAPVSQGTEVPATQQTELRSPRYVTPAYAQESSKPAFSITPEQAHKDPVIRAINTAKKAMNWYDAAKQLMPNSLDDSGI